MYLTMKDQDIEKWNTIPLTDYVETMSQGYCDECGENIPQEHGLLGFWCSEHGGIKQGEKKCLDCGEPLKLNLGYFLMNGTITQYRKPYLLCGCDDDLWLTFARDADRSMSKGENNSLICTVKGFKWVHSLRNTLYIGKMWKEKLVKIPKQHLSELSQPEAEIYLLEDHLNSKIGDTRQSAWYSKLIADAIELGVNIETLQMLLSQAVSPYWGYMNWSIQNSVRQIIEHNPTFFYQLIPQKFETSSIAIRRILGGESDNTSITIYTFNEKFTQCNTVENKINDYTQKSKRFRTKVINKCIAHCDAVEYEFRETNSHQDFIIASAFENIQNLCDLYNDYVLDSIGTLSSVQNLDIEVPYKITYGSLVKLNYEAKRQLIELLSDLDKQVTNIYSSRVASVEGYN